MKLTYQEIFSIWSSFLKVEKTPKTSNTSLKLNTGRSSNCTWRSTSRIRLWFRKVVSETWSIWKSKTQVCLYLRRLVWHLESRIRYSNRPFRNNYQKTWTERQSKTKHKVQKTHWLELFLHKCSYRYLPKSTLLRSLQRISASSCAHFSPYFRHQFLPTQKFI